MAANKRTKLERERDLEKISKEYLRGNTQIEIAQHFGVSQVQISYDLKILQKRWLESSLVNVDQARAKELAKIDALERTYYEAWDGSLVEKETKTAEKTTGGESDRIKAVSRHEQRDGNPAFLAGVQWCIEQRCKILGIVQKPETEVNVQVNDKSLTLWGALKKDDIRKLLPSLGRQSALPAINGTTAETNPATSVAPQTNPLTNGTAPQANGDLPHS